MNMTMTKTIIISLMILLALPSTYAVGADFYIIDATPTTLAPGDTTTMDLTIKNLGSGIGVFLRSELDPSDTSPMTAIGSPKKHLDLARAAEGTEYYGIVTQEEVEFQYDIHIDDNATIGAYNVPLLLTWEDELRTTQTQTLNIGISIVGVSDLAISKVDLTPDRVYPDSDFTLSLELENIGDDKAKVVECNLEMPPVFSGEDMAFLGTITKGSKSTALYNLKASKEAQNQAYDFKAFITYEDSEGQKTMEKPFKVFVSKRGEIDLEIAGVSTSPAKIYPGTDFTLSVQLENIGTQDAKSVMATISNSEGFVGEFSSFIGKIESDDVSSGIFDLTPIPAVTPGDHAFNMEILFTDEKGDEFTETKTFNVYIDTLPEKSPVGTVVILAVVVIVAVIIWRRRKASQILDE